MGRVTFLQVNLLASNITGRLKSETWVLKSVLLTGACEQRADREEEDTKHKQKTKIMVMTMNNRNVKKDKHHTPEETKVQLELRKCNR